MTTQSYSFQNNVRSLDEAFFTIVQDSQTFLSLIPYNPSSPCLNTKHEWLNDSLTPTRSAIASFDTDGDGTGVNLASTAGFTAGDIIRFESSAGGSKTEVAKIASVDSGTDLTIVRDYGDSTGVTLSTGDVVVLLSSPKTEGTDASTGSAHEPSTNYNYTEIFDAIAELSKTAANVRNYGFQSVEEKLNYQVEVKLRNVIMRNMNNAAIYGRRVIRSGSQKGTMGGILQYLTGGNVTNVGGALSASVINALMEDIFEDGGYSSNYVILCAQNQARRISGFLTPTTQQPTIQGAFGGAITQFRGDLPVQKGFNASIVVDPMFPKDQLAILDMDMIELKNLENRPLIDEDATLPGGDYYRRRILGEYTLQMKNADKVNGLLTGLTI